jgi:hypothetical protein
LATSPFRITTSSFFQLNTCFHSSYVTFFPKIRWVSSLQFLLVLASTVILKADCRRTRDHILLSQIWDSTVARLVSSLYNSFARTE